MATLNIKLKTRMLAIEKYENGEQVTNDFSGQSAYLNPDALALYDWIMGISMILEDPGVEGQKKVIVERATPGEPHYIALIDVDESIILFDEARAYFRSHWPKEYMILLD